MEYDEVCKRLENDPELLAFVNHLLTENYELKKYCASLERQINQNSKNSIRPLREMYSNESPKNAKR
ncbi:hypothetical protein SDC9_23561 [bioreactor metagenome]|uniref:Uncharacterized protein n=1 Tax=bioreactor metagenome TaxID=1076179 RepID=A0A644UFI9_9ZZZZ